MEEQVKDVILGEQEEYVINMGPQHPSTHGVLRLVVSLKGECSAASRIHTQRDREDV
jgi:NADH-quinone oxidoreductase subunit C/D